MPGCATGQRSTGCPDAQPLKVHNFVCVDIQSTLTHAHTKKTSRGAAKKKVRLWACLVRYVGDYYKYITDDLLRAILGKFCLCIRFKKDGLTIHRRVIHPKSFHSTGCKSCSTGCPVKLKVSASVRNMYIMTRFCRVIRVVYVVLCSVAAPTYISLRS